MYRETEPLPPLLVTAFRGWVLALASDTGREVWRTRPFPEGLVRLHVDREQVVAAGLGGIVVLSYATGELLQQIQIEGGTTALLVHGTRAFVSQNGTAIAVDLAAGKELWRNQLPGTGYGAAAIGVPGTVVQADHDT
jgi:outer membrane protein assembly factor BamB